MPVPDSWEEKPQDELTVRMITRSFYQIQDLRQQVGKRIHANFESRFEDREEDPNDIVKEAVQEFDSITEGVATLTEVGDLPEGSIIETQAELALIEHFKGLAEEEKSLKKQIEPALEGIAIYDQFLEDITGLGPALCGVIVGEFNPTKAPYPSSFWKYAGLDVVSSDDGPSGEARSRKQEHLEEFEYEDSDGETQTTKGLRHNPFVKKKMVGPYGIADQFIRHKVDPYRKRYDDYRHRIETELEDPEHWRGPEEEYPASRLLRMGRRVAAKEFLKDLYNAWRPLADRDVAPTYQERNRGHGHHEAE